MFTTDRTTLAQYLMEACRRPGQPTDIDLANLLLDVALACKSIGRTVALGSLAGVLGSAGSENVQGETQKKMDVISDETFRRLTEWGGHVAALASEEQEHPCPVPERFERGPYLLLYDPLDGSSNIDVNVAVGSIFSVLKAPAGPAPVTEADFLQPGVRQVAAGYALYGPSTLLVLTVGQGVHIFTLEPGLGEFILTASHIAIPAETQEFAINASNSRFWEAPVSRYVEECLAGQSGPREKDFNMRWIASLVADAHRVLMRGGVYLYPRDNKKPAKPGRLRLLYEANPVALLMEQAGGLATTGSERLLEVAPTSLHQRIPLIFGSRAEVERIIAYHRDQDRARPDTPLFNTRGLFRTPA
ncbi:fructose-1,6-bisphosphatase class 1 [mine drainage metagenome]|uniref:fructose-bisphosphatase n=1 Tax=mine drainage metagenome TaxID=410659 RepID=A0A1J5R0C5_9ZZZZ